MLVGVAGKVFANEVFADIQMVKLHAKETPHGICGRFDDRVARVVERSNKHML